MKFSLLFITVIFFFAACNNQTDKELFNGEIRYINDSRVVTKDVIAKHVPLEGDYAGMIAVHVSLLVCGEPAYENYLLDVFNVDTGKEIGCFCPKGQGPGEYSHMNPVYQFFEKEGHLMSLFQADSESLLFWDITQSVQAGETVYDTIVPCNLGNNLFLFYLTGDTLLNYVSASYSTKDESTTPFYEKRDIYTGQVVAKYPIYKVKSVQNNQAKKSMGLFFYSWDILKPDGTRIVQAMRNLPQLNIIDTRTGQVVGYRMKDGPDYSLLQTTMENLTKYYINVQANDQYIYAVYWGKEPWDGSPKASLPQFDMIHVFDWEGNLLYKLKADCSFFITWLDTARNRLYTRDWNTDEIYYLDLNELGL